jgi:hypothetical protein
MATTVYPQLSWTRNVRAVNKYQPGSFRSFRISGDHLVEFWVAQIRQDGVWYLDIYVDRDHLGRHPVGGRDVAKLLAQRESDRLYDAATGS